MDLTALAARFTELQATYERLSAECWEALNVSGAIRYRGAAEAYRQAVNEVAAFAQRQTPGGEGR